MLGHLREEVFLCLTNICKLKVPYNLFICVNTVTQMLIRFFLSTTHPSNVLIFFNSSNFSSFYGLKMIRRRKAETSQVSDKFKVVVQQICPQLLFSRLCVIGKRGDSSMREEGGRSLSRVEVKARILPIMSLEKLGENKHFIPNSSVTTVLI